MNLVFWLIIAVTIIAINATKYRHETFLRLPGVQLRDAQRRIRELESAPASSTSVVQQEGAVQVQGLADGRVGGESTLMRLPSPDRSSDPRISSSEEIFDRLQNGMGLKILLPFERVMELRKSRNGGKPIAELVAPVIDVDYEVIDDRLAPEIIDDVMIQPWEHDLAVSMS